MIGFYDRVRHETRETRIDEKRSALVLDTTAILARLAIEDIPRDLWPVYLDTAEFLYGIERCDADIRPYLSESDGR